MRVRIAILLTVLTVAIVPLSGRRANVVWNLSGVTFADGGTATGTFTYDATTNTYSAVSIATSPGLVRSGSTYTFPNSVSDANALLATNANPAGNLTGTPVIGLLFAAPLTNAGGVITISLGISQEGDCATANCQGATPTTPRLVSGGSVVSVSAPVPTMPEWFALMLAVGLAGGVAWKLRRRIPVRESR